MQSNVVKMPIKKVEIDLTEYGYPGFVAIMRTNPRSADYDLFLSENTEEEWKGFGKVVISWNFADEEGNPIPLPSEGLKRSDLPYDLLRPLISKYAKSFWDINALPKEPQDNSASTSQIGEDRQNGVGGTDHPVNI